MSGKRLDSLSRPTSASSGTSDAPVKPAATAGLKFKPKAVARKSKEERDAVIPQIKEEPRKRRPATRGGAANRGRGRGNKFMNNTRLISSGPLAAGNFVSGGSDARAGFNRSGSPTATLLQTIKREDGEGRADGESDDEDPTKIDMGKEHKFQDAQVSELFPVTALRIKHEEVDEVKTELQEALSDPSTREGTPGLMGVLQQRDLELQERLNRLRLQDEFNSMDIKEAEEEIKLLNNDYKHIVNKLDKLNNDPHHFMFFQLPKVLPKFEAPEQDVEISEVAAEAVAAEAVAEASAQPKAESKAQAQAPAEKKVEGQIGKLRVHKSGKVTMQIGNVIMDVSRGAEASFLQDVIALSEEDSMASVLGNVDGKVVVTPSF